MHHIIAAIIFRSIQIVLLPFGLVGYVLCTVKAITFGRTSGVSATALGPLYARWMQHKLGLRPDEPCERLMMVLPGIPQLGLHLATGPTLLAHCLTGYVPRVYRYPYEGTAPIAHEPAARVTYFDAALDRHLGDIGQFVLLGAGFDTRAYRLPAGTRVRSFEVDAPKTQACKREMLKRAGVDTTQVTFVAADFLTEDWLEKLVAAGFDPDTPSFFLWEGVTMYLDRETVEGTLRKIAGTATGSVVAFDYLAAHVIAGGSLYMRYATAALNIAGEPLRFGIDTTPPTRQQVAAFLESCGLSLDEQINCGHETDRKRPMAGFATAIV